MIVPLSLAFLFRMSFAATMVSMRLFKLISLGIAPAGYAVGRYLLDPSRGLDRLWRVLFHLPVAAPIGYNRYLLLGSMVISFGIAVPVFFGVRFAVKAYRERLGALAPGKEVPLSGDFERLASEVRERAEAIIRGRTGDVPDITDALNGLFRSLIPQPEEE